MRQGSDSSRITAHEEGLGIVDVFDENPELYTLLVNPTVAAPRKKDIVKNVFGGRVSQEMENFLYVLIDKGRMRNFPRIVREYEKLLDEEQGFADGVVYSVIALNDERIERIEEQTSRLLNHNVKLRNETDASLIGGIKVMKAAAAAAEKSAAPKAESALEEEQAEA